MTSRIGSSLLLIAALVLTGCRSASPVAPEPGALQKFQYESSHMGTMFYITLYATNEVSANAAARAAFERVERLDEVMSDYRADSELSLLREVPAGKPVTVSDDLFRLLQRAQELSRVSQGAFDVTIGPYVRLWRFSRKRKELPAETELAEARRTVGYRKLALDPGRHEATLKVSGMRLDVGGIAKGFAADEALKELKWRGVNRAFVAASGDIALGDAPPGQCGWRVAVTGIDAETNALSRHLLLSNAGISTSGDVEQFVEIDHVRYSHIVDPSTGLGLTNRIQATVVARNATTTDALATAVCIMGMNEGLQLIRRVPDAEGFVLQKKEAVQIQRATRGFLRLLEAREPARANGVR